MYKKMRLGIKRIVDWLKKLFKKGDTRQTAINQLYEDIYYPDN